jgi:ribosomal RNA assembly protein
MSEANVFVKIPHDRVGVLIGNEGQVKELLEKRLGVTLEIDSHSGDVKISLSPTTKDFSLLLRAKEVVTAIGRGFSPERANRLIEDENSALYLIDLREIFGKSESDIKRVKGRIIGKEGKTRKLIEELTESYISVYGHTIGIIGNIENAQIAKEAIEMLLQGRQHATVYKFLHRKRQEIKRKKLELWETAENRFKV